MSISVSHTDFTDATTLFADLAAANAMLDGLSVPTSTTGAEGVAKKGVAVTSPSGDSAANNQTAIIALLVSLRNADIIEE
jgi:hypothetical protein